MTLLAASAAMLAIMALSNRPAIPHLVRSTCNPCNEAEFATHELSNGKTHSVRLECCMIEPSSSLVSPHRPTPPPAGRYGGVAGLVRQRIRRARI